MAAAGVPRHLLVARPWRSRLGRVLHRALDAAAWSALDRDRDPGRRATAAQLEGLAVSYDQKPSIVLAELWERQSSKGNAYFSGFMGNVSVALLRDGERPHPTRPSETVTVWKLSPRSGTGRQSRLQARQSAIRWRGGKIPSPPKPPGAGTRPGVPQRPFRRESEAARREHGLERDPDDSLPF